MADYNFPDSPSVDDVWPVVDPIWICTSAGPPAIWAPIPAGVTNPGVIYPPMTPPLAADFTPFGSGLTFTDKSNRLQASIISTSGFLVGGYMSSIATPYTVDVGVSLSGSTSQSDYLIAGLGVSDGTAYRMWYAGAYGGGSGIDPIVRGILDSWTTASSGRSLFGAFGATLNLGMFFLRLTDDGINRIYYLSNNGLDYVPAYSEGTNVGLTPTRFVLGFYENVGTPPAKASIFHWKVTASVLGDAA